MWAAGALGLGVTVALLVREGLPEVLQLLRIAGWRLLWLVPLHIIPLACYGVAWSALLKGDHKPGYGYLAWGAIVREAVQLLLPVASVAGEVVGVRLLVRRQIPLPTASASVIVELSLTIAAQAIFAATGLALLADQSRIGRAGRVVIIGLLASLVAVPGLVFTVRRWGGDIAAFALRAVERLGGVTEGSRAGEPARFHAAIEALFADRRALLACGLWQLLGFFLQSVETWVMLRIVGAPATARGAVILESMANTLQSTTFLIPFNLGTQEGGFLLFGAALGLTPQTALALSLARRVRQVLLGVPALMSWYWVERRGKV